ncbi:MULTISPECIES: hypothetical protein [Mycolicibacter]|uniref:Uncharacterized protein n=2 Tax=Mycolicibacter TaxID=1073531 RepID=A0ABU5XL58_9MYCO|nr:MULTISPECIES: hypothetical protein [unclassified Mycolicibacter]MEB3022939.1 hypothetical protein [Mycolicibacter sp. MYC098]MEB3035074.1 hypothetical protein [Mycolicibacter sp. MYC340]
MSAAERARLDTLVNELLTNRALSDDDADGLMDSMLAAIMPPEQPRPAAPVPPAREAQPEPDWAADQAPSVAAPLPPAGGGESSLSGAGGAVYMPTADPVHAADDDDDDDDDEDEDDERYPMWRSPPRPTVEVPDDVEGISPVAEPEPGAAPEPVDPVAPQQYSHSGPPSPLPGADRPTRPALKARWEGLQGWVKVAAIVGAVVSLLVVQQILGAYRSRQPVLAGPPPAVVTPTVQPGGPAPGPLQPGCPPNSGSGCLPVHADSCPGGSSDPSLAFGSDAGAAWICGRLHNIDLQQITIEFPRPVVVTSIVVVPGFAYVEPNGQDHWLEHRLVTSINWRLGGQQVIQNIKPTRDGATLELPRVATQRIVGTILSSERPPAVNSPTGPLPGILGGPDQAKIDESIAISRIVVNGYPAGAT